MTSECNSLRGVRVPEPGVPSDVEVWADRLFRESVAGCHLLVVYLGIRLGLYEALSENPDVTARRLASMLGLDEWYVREWLQAETVAGLVMADAEEMDASRFRLATGVAEVLVEETNPSYLGGLAFALSALGSVLPLLVDAFHTGKGVPSSAYGPEGVHARGALNRPMFVNELVSKWLPVLPDVWSRLQVVDVPARVADIGCGVGWAAIELAKAFPHITIDCFDDDEASIRQARKHAADHGVSDRIRFAVVDVLNAPLDEGVYDLMLFLACVHDMARPVEALAEARRALAVGGTVLVMNERTADVRPTAGDAVQTLFASFNVLWCLPQIRVTPDCEAPGSIMGTAQFDEFVRRAGWDAATPAPIDHPLWHFSFLVH